RDVSDAVEGGGVAIVSVDGGTVDGVLVSKVVMQGVDAPIFVRLGDRGRDRAEGAPGRVRNVSLSGIVASGAAGTASIAGLVGHPVEGVTIADVRIGASGGARRRPALDVPELVGVFLRVTGESTRSLALAGNAYWTPGPVELAPELAPEAVVQAIATDPPGARAKKL